MNPVDILETLSNLDLDRLTNQLNFEPSNGTLCVNTETGEGVPFELAMTAPPVFTITGHLHALVQIEVAFYCQARSAESASIPLELVAPIPSEVIAKMPLDIQVESYELSAPTVMSYEKANDKLEAALKENRVAAMGSVASPHGNKFTHKFSLPGNFEGRIEILVSMLCRKPSVEQVCMHFNFRFGGGRYVEDGHGDGEESLREAANAFARASRKIVVIAKEGIAGIPNVSGPPAMQIEMQPETFVDGVKCVRYTVNQPTNGTLSVIPGLLPRHNTARFVSTQNALTIVSYPTQYKNDDASCDVVLLVDTSGSMSLDLTSTVNRPANREGCMSRLGAIKATIVEALQMLLHNNKQICIKIAAFHTYVTGLDDAPCRTEREVKTCLHEMVSGGGTRLVDAIRNATRVTKTLVVFTDDDVDIKEVSSDTVNECAIHAIVVGNIADGQNMKAIVKASEQYGGSYGPQLLCETRISQKGPNSCSAYLHRILSQTAKPPSRIFDANGEPLDSMLVPETSMVAVYHSPSLIDPLRFECSDGTLTFVPLPPNPKRVDDGPLEIAHRFVLFEKASCLNNRDEMLKLALNDADNQKDAFIVPKLTALYTEVPAEPPVVDDFVIIYDNEEAAPAYRSLSSFQIDDEEAAPAYRSLSSFQIDDDFAVKQPKIQKKELTTDVLLGIPPLQFTTPKKLTRFLKGYELPAHATEIQLLLELLNFCIQRGSSDQVEKFISSIVRCLKIRAERYHLTEVDKLIHKIVTHQLGARSG